MSGERWKLRRMPAGLIFWEPTPLQPLARQQGACQRQRPIAAGSGTEQLPRNPENKRTQPRPKAANTPAHRSLWPPLPPTYPRRMTRGRLSPTTTATTPRAGPAQNCDGSTKGSERNGEVVGGFHGNLFLYIQDELSLTFGWHRFRGFLRVAGVSSSLSLRASV